MFYHFLVGGTPPQSRDSVFCSFCRVSFVSQVPRFCSFCRVSFATFTGFILFATYLFKKTRDKKNKTAELILWGGVPPRPEKNVFGLPTWGVPRPVKIIFGVPTWGGTPDQKKIVFGVPSWGGGFRELPK